jgi:hypothetical protein
LHDPGEKEPLLIRSDHSIHLQYRLLPPTYFFLFLQVWIPVEIYIARGMYVPGNLSLLRKRPQQGLQICDNPSPEWSEVKPMPILIFEEPSGLRAVG